jgi:uracil-DNA glycosylase family 4
MSLTTKKGKLQTIYQELLNLKKSPLYKYRVKNNYQPVIGDGSLDAKVVFIGEAPGKNEALSGKPFVGAAGKILDELLASINLNRQDVYISNIVNDRPPDNRDPTPAEIKLYSPFLDRLVSIIRPQILAPLGRFSMKYLLEKYDRPEAKEPISKLHGKPIQVSTEQSAIIILPLYHPASALYRGRVLTDMKKDFLTLKKLLKPR